MSPGGVHCPIYEPCVLRDALSRAANAFVAELDRWTLADLIEKRRPLVLSLNSARLWPVRDGRTTASH
jgi:DNA-binding IscR family transcriptional regulator